MTRETKCPAPGVDRDGAGSVVQQASERRTSPFSPCESQPSPSGNSSAPAGEQGARSREPQEIIALLAARFPRCFFVDMERRVPLKLLIFHDLRVVLGERVSPEDLSAALRHYISNEFYWRRCIRGASRFNLAGAEEGEVRIEEAEYAQACTQAQNPKVQVPRRAWGLGRGR
jgi:hypothetical protein